MPEITGLKEVSASQVLVELDGAPWRKVPLNAAARAGLRAGKRLEREDLRLLRREIRRAEALTGATRMLALRPLSRALLEERLERKGVAPVDREEAADVLERAHYLDDRAYALDRARGLAERGYGDTAVRHLLAQERVASELIQEAVALLEPELERARVIARTVHDRQKLAARLTRRGFGPETVEQLAGEEVD
jgi:SOS response regulatory protein OraA/RecX